MTRADRIRYSQNAGWRSTQRPRSTGRPVSIYDGSAAGMDVDGGRWQTVCEDHGYLISHQTLALARHHAPDPDGWCGICNGSEADDDDTDLCPDGDTHPASDCHRFGRQAYIDELYELAPWGSSPNQLRGWAAGG